MSIGETGFMEEIISVYIPKISMTMLHLFGQLWHFLLIGIIVSSLISVFWSEYKVASFCQRLHNSHGVSFFIAALVGVISPLPTYTTIPLIAALFKVGAPATVLFTFLVSSPLMNPTLFSLTLGAFGYQMAAARLIASLAVGMAAGYSMQLLISRNRFGGFVRNQSGVSELFDRLDKTPMTIKSYISSFFNQFYRLAKFTSKYFFLGIAIAALVKVFIPPGWIIKTLGSHRIISIFIAVAGGVPFYACGGGAIPVMQTLEDLGMDKGAVLAFFISGPATKVSTLVALKTTMTNQTFILYLITVFAGAVFFGFLYSIW